MDGPANLVFQLHSVQRFIDSIVDDLQGRRSVLLLLPLGIEPSFVWRALSRELRRRDLWIDEIELPMLQKDSSPVQCLGDALKIEWHRPDLPRTVGNLASHVTRQDLLVLHGANDLGPDTLQAWMRFLELWASASQSSYDVDRMPAAMLMIARASDIINCLPDNNVYLSLRWWWGIPSALEARLLCRFQEHDRAWESGHRWREYILPALAGSDLSLYDLLSDDESLASGILRERLIGLASQRGWDYNHLVEWHADDFVNPRLNVDSLPRPEPPEIARRLWAHGALGWTPEYGIELHPAALLVLGREEELNHRLWRGQAELLLPVIDHVRLTICQHLTQFYGTDWPLRWDVPETTVEQEELLDSPLTCQWGYLEHLLSKCVFLRGEKRLLPLVALARRIRNELAHYRPVTYADYQQLHYEIARTITRR